MENWQGIWCQDKKLSWDKDRYKASSEPEMAAKRNAEAVFSLCLGTFLAYCHIFPGCWTKGELESQHGCSLSPVAGICTGAIKGRPTPWITCMGLNDMAKYKNLFFLCEPCFNSSLKLFFSSSWWFWVLLTPAEYASHEGSECWHSEQLFWQTMRCAKKVFLHFVLPPGQG